MTAYHVLDPFIGFQMMTGIPGRFLRMRQTVQAVSRFMPVIKKEVMQHRSLQQYLPVRMQTEDAVQPVGSPGYILTVLVGRDPPVLQKSLHALHMEIVLDLLEDLLRFPVFPAVHTCIITDIFRSLEKEPVSFLSFPAFFVSLHMVSSGMLR